jgi:long-chain fatty acid transport protein
MNRFTLAVIATISGSATAMAGGLDRSGQNINILFEEGAYAELSLGYVAPDLTGVDSVGPGAGTPTGDVGGNFIQAGFGYKQDINEQLSFAVIVDQPYGANIQYTTAAAGGSDLLGGTSAALDSTAITGLLRYKINDRFSVHGGIRAQTVNATVTLQGGAFAAFGPGGFATNLEGDTAYGYQIGGAYEIPEIALRLAVTYFSEIDHDFRTTENIAPGAVTTTEVTTPEAINISFQTGIAADTLLFASFRYADYGVVQVTPAAFGAATGGASLTDIDTARDFSIGVGRAFTDKFSASVAFNYSDEGTDDLVSPLAPTNGTVGITLAGSYQVTDQVKLSGGLNYTRVGDAIAAPGGNPVTAFDDNDAIGIGFRIG